MMMPLRNVITVALLTAGVAHAHYANMGLDGVSCYIYNGIKGTPDGHLIVRNSNGTWFDHDDASNHGSITVIHDQADYDKLAEKTKVGIVCAPDSLDSTEIGVPYLEMEPTDAEFYDSQQTVYTRSLTKRVGIECIIRFCHVSAAMCTQYYRIVIYSCLDGKREDTNFELCSDPSKEDHEIFERSLASARRDSKRGQHDCRDPPKE